MSDPTNPRNVPSGHPSGPLRPVHPAPPPPAFSRRPPARRPPAPSPVVASQWPSYGQPPAAGPHPPATDDPGRTAYDLVPRSPRPSRPPGGRGRGSLSAGILWVLAWSAVISVVFPLISTMVFDRPILWAWPLAAALFAAFLYSYSRR